MNQPSASRESASFSQRFNLREVARSAVILFLVPACRPSLIAQPSQQGSWRVEETVDQMTGQKGFQAALWADASSQAGRARAKVIATCSSEFLQINIIYAADFDKTLGFKEIQPDSTVYYNQIHTPKPRVDLRVGIDEAPVSVVSSEADHPNEVNLYFTPDSTDQAMANMHAAQGTHSAMPLLRLFAAANSAGTIEQIYKAHLIKWNCL